MKDEFDGFVGWGEGIDSGCNEDDPRNHEYKGYICLCFVCGNKYLGPKRSVMCNLCANGKKPVDKE